MPLSATIRGNCLSLKRRSTYWQESC